MSGILDNVFSVQDYGAIGDGIANDLAALQLAVDACDVAGGGTVYLPRGIYNIGSGQWIIGRANAQHYVNIIGEGPTNSRIVSVNPSSSAIYLQHEKYVSIKGFALAGTAQSGTGIAIGGDGGSGTQTNGCVLESIAVGNFNWGISTSGGLGTCSEITFINVSISGCAVGFRNADFNGLNFVFINPQISNNAIGFDMITAGLNVFGGAAANNGTDFLFQNIGENVIIGFRSEGAGVFLQNNSSTSKATLLLSAVNVEGIANPSAQNVVINAGPGQLTIQNSVIGGQILWRGGNIVLKNNSIIDPNNTYTTTAAPNLMGPGFRLSNSNEGRGQYFESTGNRILNAGGLVLGVWPDGHGIITANPATTVSFCFMYGSGQGAALTITNGAIFPTSYIHHVGAGNLQNITAPVADPASGTFNPGSIHLIPDDAFTYDNTGNIAGSGTAVIGRVMTMFYDLATSKWYPSY